MSEQPAPDDLPARAGDRHGSVSEALLDDAAEKYQNVSFSLDPDGQWTVKGGLHQGRGATPDESLKELLDNPKVAGGDPGRQVQ